LNLIKVKSDENEIKDKKEEKPKTKKVMHFYDEDKEICYAGNKKVICLHIKQLYIWFMKNVNEHGTLTNKLTYMVLVDLLNSTEAKQLFLFDDIIDTLEWLAEKSMEEVSLIDLVVGI